MIGSKAKLSPEVRALLDRERRDFGPARRRPCPDALSCARCAGRGGGHAADPVEGTVGSSMGGGGGAGLRGNGRGGRGRVQRGCPRPAGCAAGRRSAARGIPRPSLERGRRADRSTCSLARCSTRGRPAPQLALSARSCVFSSRRGRPWHERTSCWRSNCSPNTRVASERGGWWKKGKRCASSPWRVLAAAARRAAQPPISKRISRAAHFCRPSASCSIRCLDAGSVHR